MKWKALFLSAGLFSFGCANPQLAAYRIATDQSEDAQRLCESRRSSGELHSYVEAANCANASTFSAFRSVNYPFMDLINLYVSAQLAGAERVDKKQVGPAQAQYELAELRVRIEGEARRRFSQAAQAQAASLQALLVGLSALQSQPSTLPYGAYRLQNEGMTCLTSGPLTTCR